MRGLFKLAFDQMPPDLEGGGRHQSQPKTGQIRSQNGHRDQPPQQSLLTGVFPNDLPESAVFRVGHDCERPAIVDHLERLTAMIESPSTTGIRLGLCCIFLEQPIKFRNTTVRPSAA